MGFGAILLLAVGLAADAAAVSAARGLATRRARPRELLIVAAWFGGFQALMPLLGWLVGDGIGPWVRAWTAPLACAVLSALGIKMLLEARTPRPEPTADEGLFDAPVMLPLAVATSLDALAAGVTLPLLGAPLALSLATIGVTTALLSALGLAAGRRLGASIGRRLDVLGGLVLIALGVKLWVRP